MTSGMAVIWSITAISVERALVVCHIVMAKHHLVNKTKMTKIVIGLWMSAIATSLPPLFGWNNYVYEVKYIIF